MWVKIQTPLNLMLKNICLLRASICEFRDTFVTFQWVYGLKGLCIHPPKALTPYTLNDFGLFYFNLRNISIVGKFGGEGNRWLTFIFMYFKPHEFNYILNGSSGIPPTRDSIHRTYPNLTFYNTTLIYIT